jgi:hypothetical protein
MVPLLISHIYAPSGVAEEGKRRGTRGAFVKLRLSKWIKVFARLARPMNERHIHLAFLDYAPFTSLI